MAKKLGTFLASIAILGGLVGLFLLPRGGLFLDHAVDIVLCGVLLSSGLLYFWMTFDRD
jgi:hypothetical protein